MHIYNNVRRAMYTRYVELQIMYYKCRLIDILLYINTYNEHIYNMFTVYNT